MYRIQSGHIRIEAKNLTLPTVRCYYEQETLEPLYFHHLPYCPFCSGLSYRSTSVVEVGTCSTFSYGVSSTTPSSVCIFPRFCLSKKNHSYSLICFYPMKTKSVSIHVVYGTYLMRSTTTTTTMMTNPITPTTVPTNKPMLLLLVTTGITSTMRRKL